MSFCTYVGFYTYKEVGPFYLCANLLHVEPVVFDSVEEVPVEDYELPLSSAEVLEAGE